ncbi:hypothetical protein MTR_6g470950 [Medicago truncatula]|uniref:Uncharacterized protein n=1 Tax=Medicago truncatula TaxID=3880 RepID=A0A072UAL7_MEDTR|nr:hypothetical protein MTR_6g470950 [Medicago truncatula]
MTSQRSANQSWFKDSTIKDVMHVNYEAVQPNMTATISSQLSTEKKASPKAKVIAKAIRIITSTRIYSQ